MALPRPRQLRRDKVLLPLALNAIRLHLEEADRLQYQPSLRETPDESLLFLQQCADRWVSLAVSYLIQKYRCPMSAALELLGDLQADLKRGIPMAELRQLPLHEALNLPAQLLPAQPTGEVSPTTEEVELTNNKASPSSVVE